MPPYEPPHWFIISYNGNDIAQQKFKTYQEALAYINNIDISSTDATETNYLIHNGPDMLYEGTRQQANNFISSLQILRVLDPALQPTTTRPLINSRGNIPNLTPNHNPFNPEN
jgi:hypothetical protein